MGIYEAPNGFAQREEANAALSEHHQTQLAIQQDAERIFTYLERHCAPVDIPLFRYLMGVQVKPRNTAQMPLGWGEGKNLC